MNIILNVEKVEDREPLRQAVESVVSQVSSGLDLGILEQIVIPNDFGQELLAFQREHGLREGFTDTEHGRAFGKTLYYFVNGQLKSTIFLDSHVSYGLFSDDLRQFSANLIHHELCHVHDETIKSKDIGTELVNNKGDNLKTALLIHADSIWSEYIAVKLSYPTIDREGEDPYYTGYFMDLIDITKDDVDKAILSSRQSRDWFSLFKATQMSANLLMRMAATLLASIHTIDDKKIDNTLDDFITKTYLKGIWGDLNYELKWLHERHGRWENINSLDNLADIIYRVWNALNVEVKDLGEDGVYVGIINN